MFQNLKFSKIIYHVQMMCNVHSIHNKVIIYNTKKNPQIIDIF